MRSRTCTTPLTRPTSAPTASTSGDTEEAEIVAVRAVAHGAVDRITARERQHALDRKVDRAHQDDEGRAERRAPAGSWPSAAIRTKFPKLRKLGSIGADDGAKRGPGPRPGSSGRADARQARPARPPVRPASRRALGWAGLASALIRSLPPASDWNETQGGAPRRSAVDCAVRSAPIPATGASAVDRSSAPASRRRSAR